MTIHRSAVMILLLALFLAAQNSGRLSGRVLADESDRPLVGATVVAVQQDVNLTSGPAIARAITEADGSFSIVGMVPGKYTLCIYSAGDYLDPCQWSGGVAAAVSEDTGPIIIRLQRGARLSVRIHDPLKLVVHGKQETAGPPSLLPVAILTASVQESGRGRLRLLSLTSRSEQMYEYSELLPVGKDFRLIITSKVFLLSDATGMSIDEKGYSRDIRLSLPRDVGAPGMPVIRLPFGHAPTAATVIPLTIRGVTGASL